MQNILEQREFYSHIIAKNPLFLRLLADFYQNFVYTIPQRLFSIAHVKIAKFDGMYDFLMQSKGLENHDEFFAKAMGIQNDKNEDFCTQASRIALLPRPYLHLLVITAGMALCREKVIKAVSRDQVDKIRKLEQCLPEQNTCFEKPNMSPYTFTLHKANMYSGHIERVLQSAKADDCTHEFETLPIEEQIIAWGLWSVVSCVQMGGQNLLLRTLINLDVFCELLPNTQLFTQHLAFINEDMKQEHYAPYSTPNSQEALAWPLVRVLLCKEIPCPWEEGWTTLFV